MRTGLTGREWIATIIVILGCGVLVRLGLWQLDRHQQRQDFNNRVEAQQILPSLELDAAIHTGLLTEMEYRSVTAVGEYRFADQVALSNQAWENLPGVHLITPLDIEGTEYTVLVDRGWIPLADASPDRWAKYDEPGQVFVSGIIRASTLRPEIGSKSDPTPPPGQGGLKEWNLLNVGRIDEQISGDLLPIYIQQGEDITKTAPPYPAASELELSSGPHLGYAGQWFLFAAILGLGYPIYLNRQRKRSTSKPAEYIRQK